MPPPASILCIAPNWVGDSVFFLPAVDALRAAHPQARLGLLARPGICELLQGPRFDELHPLPGPGRLKKFAAHWALRRHAYDLAVVFPDSFSSALAAWLSGAKRRAGRRGEGRGLFLSPGLSLPPRKRDKHVVEEYLELAQACGAAPAQGPAQPELKPTASGLEEQRRLFREAGFEQGPRVALCPTSAYGPSKRWPLAHWASLAKSLAAERYAPYVLCAPGERDEVALLAREAGLKVLTPSLAGLAACLSVSELVVANDSGPLHLAAALGTRSLGLYGPVDPKWSGPRGPRTESLYRGLDCSPCFARTCPLGHHDCLQGLAPSLAMEKVASLMGRG